ncbi:MAG: hypothetical protein RIS89_751, partial [Bacteroidota bacterium]
MDFILLLNGGSDLWLEVNGKMWAGQVTQAQLSLSHSLHSAILIEQEYAAR